MAGVPRRTVLGWLLGLPAVLMGGRRGYATGGVVSLVGPDVDWGCVVPLRSGRSVPVPGVTIHVTAFDGARVADVLRSPNGRAAILTGLGTMRREI